MLDACENSLDSSTGSNLSASGSSGAADLRDTREMERLSPISSAVSTFKVPRQFGHMGKTASKQRTSASQQVNRLLHGGCDVAGEGPGDGPISPEGLIRHQRPTVEPLRVIKEKCAQRLSTKIINTFNFTF